LRMLLNVDQLKRTVREGINKDIWVYYQPDEKIGYGTASPPPLIEISEDVLLYTPEEAKRLGIKIKGTEVEGPTCPVFGKTPWACDDDDDGGDEKPVRVHAEGTPAQSFQAVSDQCHDQKVKALRRVSVRVEGLGKDAAKDARSVGLAIPQIGKAALSLE